jgi:hypothetical protein
MPRRRRMQATRAALFGRPRSTRFWSCWLMPGFQRVAWVAMVEGVANAGSPPSDGSQAAHLPKIAIDRGGPTRAAIRRRSSRPGSGRSAISVRAVTSRVLVDIWATIYLTE